MVTPHLVSYIADVLGLIDITSDVRRNADLSFVASPALKPPEVSIDHATQQQYEQELANASAVPLPDEDDDL